jgi:hypothetical protein
LGLCLVAGMALLGHFIAQAIRDSKRFDTFVSVKGLSEREVPADLAIWPITFTLLDNDLIALQTQINTGRATVQAFLAESGFKPEDSNNPLPQIADLEASYRGDGDKPPPFRYRANVTVLLRSNNIPAVKKAMESSGKLVQKGLALSGGDYSGRPQFQFKGLNQIKPDMIQEANRNARKAAEKFAEDSNVKVGGIRHAVQGPFEIEDVDASSQDRKMVRVVTTVDFYLE